ncbi:Beta-ketoadipate enol-lactone hydrolase [Minicystis rosea]|nr:Beta-ketoadipate enol-lactone hydrolase [Minicystis rosea]
MSMDPGQSVTSRTFRTSRIAIHALTAGPAEGFPVVFIHGNCSDGRFFREMLAALPPRFRAVAPDLRGYGATELAPLDATRGLRDFADDVHALIESPEVFGGARKVLLVGHSVGAGVAMQYTIDHPERVAGLVLEAPVSPFGFGGTRDVAGTPCFSDFAGSGGGTANPEFVKRIADQDRSADIPVAPRRVLTDCYVKPPFRPHNEEELLDSLLSTRVTDGNYPGDVVTSSNWPGVSPGTRGMNNAISPKYLRLDGFADIAERPPVLWVRGADDVIVSDTSLFDLGYLGQLGVVPGWPGVEAYPAQPMVAQMRAVLDAYKARGGRYREEVFADCGHSPHIEKAEAFAALVFPFLSEHAG